MSDQEQSGLTRRDMLKRGAIFGGAVMWATPVVQTVGMRAAFASVTSPLCTKWYAVKLEESKTDPDDGTKFCDAGGTLINPEFCCYDISSQTAPLSPGQCLDVVAVAGADPEIGTVESGGCSHISSITRDTEHQWTVRLDAFCTFIDGAVDVRGGTAGCAVPFTTEQPNARTLIFRTSGLPGTGISHVEFIFCCEHQQM